MGPNVISLIILSLARMSVRFQSGHHIFDLFFTYIRDISCTFKQVIAWAEIGCPVGLVLLKRKMDAEFRDNLP